MPHKILVSVSGHVIGAIPNGTMLAFEDGRLTSYAPGAQLIGSSSADWTLAVIDGEPQMWFFTQGGTLTLETQP